jgi:hypothetical protein
MKAWAQNDDLAKFALAFFCNVTRMQETQPITMSDRVEANRRTPTVKEAKTVFAGIRALWRSYYGRDLDALRAATADAWGDDLAWFAQRLALKHACDLAVMGHTHKPVAGVAVSPVNYINTGYLCVAGPDTRTKQFTFAQVDLERATAQVLAVTGGVKGPFKVEASRAPVIASVILGRYSDFSCYARIDNRSDRPLRRVRFAQESASFWVVPPPEVIAPRTRACVWLQDKPGVQGSAGRFTYTDGSRTFEFVLECPTGLLPNIVRSPVPGYLTRTGSRPWRRDGVDRQGHPLQVRFVVEALRPAGRFAVPPSAPAPAPPRPRVYTA